MALWLLVILVLGLQGYCLGVKKNETMLSLQESVQLKLTNTTNSTVHHDITNERRASQDSGTESVTSTSSNYSITHISNPINGIEHTTSSTHITAISIPKIITTTTEFSIVSTTKDGALTSKLSKPKDTKPKLTHSIPKISSTNLNSQDSISTTISSVKNETSSDMKNVEPLPLSSKSYLLNNNGSRSAQTHPYIPEEDFSNEEKDEMTTSITTTAENESVLETSTTAETSTQTSTEPEDWSYLETSESTSESDRVEDLFYSTTEYSSDPTTTDPVTEQGTEDTTAEGPSIPNGIAVQESLQIPGVSSPLTKLILRLSKPGVFEKGKSVFEDDLSTMTTSCPPGDIGLPCRRAEARRTADECSGGNCEVCRSCNNMAATDWPHCCRENFRCCSELALACQQCDQPTLQVFCTKHFKRCF